MTWNLFSRKSFSCIPFSRKKALCFALSILRSQRILRLVQYKQPFLILKISESTKRRKKFSECSDYYRIRLGVNMRCSYVLTMRTKAAPEKWQNHENVSCGLFFLQTLPRVWKEEQPRYRWIQTWIQMMQKHHFYWWK